MTTTPTNEAGHGLPELPEWAKRDDLGGLVPSQIRSELRAYARAALALSRGVPEVIKDRSDEIGFDDGLDAPAAAGAQGEGADRCTDPENCRRCSLDTNTPHAGIPRHSDTPQPAAADAGVRECPACKGAGEVMLPVWTHDPQDGYDAMGECPKCGGNGSAFPSALADLVHFTEHCLSAADEGEDYAVSREWLDAMTTMGIMKKNGRGKWAPTEQAQSVASALRALSSHRQAGEPEAYIESYEVGGRVRQGLVWADHPANTPDHTFVPLYTAPQTGPDLSKFRELAEEWNVRPGVTDAYKICADELMALVEKGAGNG